MLSIFFLLLFMNYQHQSHLQRDKRKLLHGNLGRGRGMPPLEPDVVEHKSNSSHERRVPIRVRQSPPVGIIN